MTVRRGFYSAFRRIGCCRWLPPGVRYRMMRALAPPDRALDHRFVVPFFGRTYRGTLARLIDWTVYFLGAHEPHVLAFLDAAARALGPSPVFLDIGGNVGHHTLFMAGRAGAVHCFEPYAPLADLIAEKIADNGLSGVAVHRIALGDRNEAREFHAPTGANVGTGTFLRAVGDGTQRPVGPIRIARGDDYLAAHGIAPIALVKIDVEGFEPHVLCGLRATLARDRPVIVMEWSWAAARELEKTGSPLSTLLPDRYAIRRIARSGSAGYRLRRTDGTPEDGELALIPEERLAAIPRRGRIR